MSARGLLADAPAWATPELGTTAQIHAATKFVQGFAAWNVWATLTYRELPDGEAPRFGRVARDAGAVLRHAARNVARAHLPCFVAVDRQRNGSLHTHALLAVPEDRVAGMTVALDTFWRRLSPATGHAHVELPSAAHVLNAIAYSLRGHGHWDLNVACPRRPRCRRRRGCVEGPSGPWF